MRADALPLSRPNSRPRPLDVARPRRSILLLAAFLALAGSVGTSGQPAEAEPDLVRLLRFMALMKGVFALAALAACLWRLARPGRGSGAGPSTPSLPP